MSEQIILFVFYSDSHLPPPRPPDRIYPQFIWQYLPPGAAGLIIAAILAAAMANISAALNSLATTTVVDFIKPLLAARGTLLEESRALKLARFVTLGWGAVLLGIGILARQWGSVLEAGLAIASIPLGALLGVFMLGVLTKHVRENHAIAGLVTGLATMTYVRFGTSIAWTWYVLIGSSVTFAVGCLAGMIGRDLRHD